MAARAALVASWPWPLRDHSSSAHQTSISTRNSVGFVLCCADPAASSSSGSNKKKAEHVDTRIHWGNSTAGWIGDDEPDATSAQSTSSASSSSSNGTSSSRRRRGNWNRNANLIDQAPDSHYRWVFVVRSHMWSGSSSLSSCWILVVSFLGAGGWGILLLWILLNSCEFHGRGGGNFLCILVSLIGWVEASLFEFFCILVSLTGWGWGILPLWIL